LDESDSGYQVITPAIVKNLGWDPIKDFAPVANILSAPQLVVVREGLPVKTLPELVAYGKANPGKLSYGSSGNGSLQHVTGEMLELQTGIDMTHVPYKGTGPTITDMLGGNVDLTFGTPPPFMAQIQAGKLRAIGSRVNRGYLAEGRRRRRRRDFGSTRRRGSRCTRPRHAEADHREAHDRDPEIMQTDAFKKAEEQGRCRLHEPAATW
jgi:hypothetical protein